MQGCELEGLPIPGDRGEHLCLAHNAALAAQEHQLSNGAGLYGTLQGKQSAGDRNNLKLRRAADPARKTYDDWRLLVESNPLRPLTKFSLGGVGHEWSMGAFLICVQITEVRQIPRQ